jgi:hypothetical protein
MSALIKYKRDKSELITDYRLWAIIHVKGKNPKKCSCKECADKGFCDKSKNPDYCAKTKKFEISFG